MEPYVSETELDVVEETTAPSLSQDAVEMASDFIFPDSNSSYLTYEDIEQLTAEEIRIAKNEIYARCGRQFDSPDLQAYFNSKRWYNGTVAPKDFSDERFNDYEKKNVIFLDNPKIDYGKSYANLIAEWESAHDYYKRHGDTADMLSFRFYGYGGDSTEAYYALYDIDNNGTPELLLSRCGVIAYIFTMKNGKPINMFGDDNDGKQCETPQSRVGSIEILSNGLIDSIDGDYTIYKIADNGYSLIKFAESHPYDYPYEANLADAKWRHYINGAEVDYDYYVQYLDEHGFSIDRNNILAKIDWVKID